MKKSQDRYKRKMTILQDFFHLLIYLMNDEISYFNYKTDLI